MEARAAHLCSPRRGAERRTEVCKQLQVCSISLYCMAIFLIIIRLSIKQVKNSISPIFSDHQRLTAPAATVRTSQRLTAPRYTHSRPFAGTRFATAPAKFLHQLRIAYTNLPENHTSTHTLYYIGQKLYKFDKKSTKFSYVYTF